MGVMACSRNGCENIMCDLYVDGYGYICFDCRSELESLDPKNKSEVIVFMESNKKDSSDNFSLDNLIYSI